MIKKFRPNRIKTKSFQLNQNKRKSAASKGYDKDWKIYRFRFLHHNPKCYCCGEKSQIVDHIINARQYPEYFKDTKNHMPLCHSCHSTITGKFDRSDIQDLDGKALYIDEYRKKKNVNVKIKVLPQYKKKGR